MCFFFQKTLKGFRDQGKFGSGALNCKILLVRIIENNKIYALFRSG